MTASRVSRENTVIEPGSYIRLYIPGIRDDTNPEGRVDVRCD
jgi:hypothetical protein